MSNPSKRKGDEFEREVVNSLNDRGIPAKRVPLSGAMTNWKGDVLLKVNHEWLQMECKRRKAGSKMIYDWLEGNHVLAIRDDKRPPLVVMTLEQFINIVGSGEK